MNRQKRTGIPMIFGLLLFLVVSLAFAESSPRILGMKIFRGTSGQQTSFTNQDLTTDFTTKDKYIYCMIKVKIPPSESAGGSSLYGTSGATQNSAKHSAILQWRTPSNEVYSQQRFGDLKQGKTYSFSSHIFLSDGIPAGQWKVVFSFDHGAPSKSLFFTIVLSNSPPEARFTFSPASPDTRSRVSFSGASSFDSDGSIRSFSWDFGDGHTGVGRYATHAFGHSGIYTVILTVIDDDGASSSTTNTIAIQDVNMPPVAHFTFSPPDPDTSSGVSFNGSASSDSDGSIRSFKWSFGDGQTSEGRYTTHVFGHSGTYTVTLTVIDDDGASSSTTNTISVQEPNKPPIARFSFSPDSPDTSTGVSFSGSASTDVDGIISSFKWNFGDGYTSEGRYTTHVFSHSGTFTVILIVTDNNGASDSTSKTITVEEPNKTPVARFTWTYAGSRVTVEPRTGKVSITFDASTSYDPDGKVTQYAWDWNSDGVYDDTSDEAISVHEFPTTGELDITLQVTDDKGATGKVTKHVTFIGPQPPSADFSFSPSAPSLLSTVSFVDESSDPDGSIVKYSWDFGDGSPASAGSNPKHKYVHKGMYTVILTITDSTGLTATKAASIIVVNIPPKAQFTFSPDHPELGMGVKFDASQSNDPDGDITSYLWDFDDNGTMDAEGSAVTWSFLKEGDYRVSLTVMDKEGDKDQTKQEIYVCSPQLVKPKQTWAVVIGISKYEYVGPNLGFPSADANAVASFFIDQAELSPDHIRTLYDSQATLSSIWAAMDWLTRVAGPDDLAIFFFAGHGYRGPDDNGDEKDGVDEFIVPYDAREAAMEATCLRDDDFGSRFIDELRSKHVIIILDSCYSGGGTRGERSLHSDFRPAAGKADIFNDFNLQGRLVLAASTEAQAAWEDPALKHGVFTYFLLQGLEGKADENNDHKVTVQELFPYVHDAVSTYTRVHKGEEQDPELIGEGRRGIELPTADIPPSVNFVWKPSIPIFGTPVQFSDMSSDADGTVQTWTWDFGDGVTSDEQNPTHVYKKQGSYNVTLKVEDDQHATSEKTLPITVSVSAPPVADFSWIPHNPWNAEMISFSDKSHAPDGKIVAWHWGFGDGTTSTEQNPLHFYSKAQKYTVTLRVQDSKGGHSEREKEIEIALSSYIIGTPAEAQNPNVYIVWLSPDDRPGAIVGAKVEVFTREVNSYGLFENMLAKGEVVDVLDAERVLIEVHQVGAAQIKTGTYVRFVASKQ